MLRRDGYGDERGKRKTRMEDGGWRMEDGGLQREDAPPRVARIVIPSVVLTTGGISIVQAVMVCRDSSVAKAPSE
jgi:hypothetical protein